MSQKGKIMPRNSAYAVSIAAIGLAGVFAGCATYGPVSFTGAVTRGQCEPSELGSGDKYYVSLRNKAGEEKNLIFQWPDSSRMCFTAGAAPTIGSTMTVTTNNKFVDPKIDTYYVPQWADITGTAP